MFMLLIFIDLLIIAITFLHSSKQKKKKINKLIS